MNRIVPPLLVALCCCSTPDAPGYDELDAERERLRDLQERVELIPPDVAASQARLQEQRAALPRMGAVTETTDKLTAAIRQCGGTVHQLTPPRLTHDLGRETQELTVSFNGLSLSMPVCALGHLARGPNLIFADTFECTRPRTAVSCALTINSIRFNDTLPVENPPALAADAAEPVQKLHAEVMALWQKTAPARELLARAQVLEAQLDTAHRLELRQKSQFELADLAEAVALTGIQPGRFAFDGDTLSVEGTIPAETARALLATIRSTEHVAIQLGELRTDPRLAPVDARSLPMLKSTGKRKKGTTVQVHAVDAEAMWLYSALAAGDETIVSTTVRGQLVTGRLDGASTRDARKTLRATQPGLAIRAVSKKSLRGRGRKVTIEITGGHTTQLFDLLGNVLGVSIIAPHDLADVTVVVRNTAADGVVKALASLLELSIDKRSGVWLLAPKASGRMPRGRGPRLDLSVVGVTASQAVAILDAIEPTRVAVPCDTPAVELWLKNVSHGDAARAVLVNADLAWPAADATGCRQEIPRIELAPVSLLGLAFGDTGGVALAKDVGGAVRLVVGETTLGDGTTLAVTRLGLFVTSPAGEATTLNLRESWSFSGEMSDLRGSRLAATLIRDGRASALLEASNGDWQLVRDGPLGGTEGPSAQVSIEPGRVTVAPDSGSAYTLRLHRRLGR